MLSEVEFNLGIAGSQESALYQMALGDQYSKLKTSRRLVQKKGGGGNGDKGLLHDQYSGEVLPEWLSGSI